MIVEKFGLKHPLQVVFVHARTNLHPPSSKEVSISPLERRKKMPFGLFPD
jgi:hypothetical protein